MPIDGGVINHKTYMVHQKPVSCFSSNFAHLEIMNMRSLRTVAQLWSPSLWDYDWRPADCVFNASWGSAPVWFIQVGWKDWCLGHGFRSNIEATSIIIQRLPWGPAGTIFPASSGVNWGSTLPSFSGYHKVSYQKVADDRCLQEISNARWRQMIEVLIDMEMFGLACALAAFLRLPFLLRSRPPLGRKKWISEHN